MEEKPPTLSVFEARSFMFVQIRQHKRKWNYLDRVIATKESSKQPKIDNLREPISMRIVWAAGPSINQDTSEDFQL